MYIYIYIHTHTYINVYIYIYIYVHYHAHYIIICTHTSSAGARGVRGLTLTNSYFYELGILMSVEFDRGSPGKFDSRTLSRETLSRWTGRIL